MTSALARPRAMARTARLLAALVAAAFAFAVTASAQEGPIPPRDLGAIDQQLHRILQVTPPGSPQSINAPSGASVSVQPYSPVTRRGGQPCVNCANPCRQYQINYVAADQSERIVMEGFRCRRSDGIWVMVQPEVIVSRQSTGAAVASNPNDPVPEMPEEELRRRGLLPQETADGTGETNGSPVPLSEDATAEGQDTASNEVESAPLPDPVQDPNAAVVDEQISAPEDGNPETVAETVDGQVPEGPRGPVRSAEARPITQDDTVSRVIYPGAAGDEAAPQPQQSAGASDDADGADMDQALSDPAVVGHLKDLQYLDSDADPADRERIRQAVGEFAVDEQFALPIDAAALSARLDAAAERNSTLAACEQDGSVVSVCREE
ncbi:hypothetical protein [Amorphus orientalis]|uniref:DUF2865 domain-containing protein n=1 Tax=Amorphus orientalis TaxID=649198 RepID=A0AAE4AQP1_9HYPH|nr:hypothetical protein [Amorphus orientalis]MDQ0314306.1 hypothetical protein [Amorphus orientalis]